MVQVDWVPHDTAGNQHSQKVEKVQENIIWGQFWIKETK